MIIKQPPIYDVSHWKEIPDFDLIEPKPFLMLTKATEGTWFKDDKFIRFMAGMKQINCHRGAYHFFRKSTGGTVQAKYFCDFIRPYIDEQTILALDMEEGGENATEILNFFAGVRNQFTNKLLWYTSKETLRTFVSTASQRELLKPMEMWYAGYPLFPDLYSVIPSGYVDSRFPNFVLWQYNEHGQIPGIIGDVDLNWITPEYQQELGEIPIIGETMQGTIKSFTNVRVYPNKNSADLGDLLTGDIVTWTRQELGLDGLTWIELIAATRNGAPVLCTDGSPVAGRYAWKNNIEIIASVTKTHQIDVFSDGSIYVDGNPYP